MVVGFSNGTFEIYKFIDKYTNIYSSHISDVIYEKTNKEKIIKKFLDENVYKKEEKTHGFIS